MTEALTWLNANPGKWVMTIGVMLLIGVAALGFEWLRDQRRGY